MNELKARLIKARILTFDESRLTDPVYAALMEQCLLIVNLPHYANETFESREQELMTLVRDLCYTMKSGVLAHDSVWSLLERAKSARCYP